MWSFFNEIKNISDAQDSPATRSAIIPTSLLKQPPLTADVAADSPCRAWQRRVEVGEPGAFVRNPTSEWQPKFIWKHIMPICTGANIVL